MASDTRTDRVKRFFGIDPALAVDDSAFQGGDSYVEEEPSVADALLYLFPTIPGTVAYLKELFPFVGWIFHYNLTWLLGDFIAGECRVTPRPLDMVMANNYRRHGWLRRRAAGHGLCQAGQLASRVWPLHVLRRFHFVLGLRDVQGHHHWRASSPRRRPPLPTRFAC